MRSLSKNIPSSVLNRLLAQSKDNKVEYQSLLTRYVAERFLYRLGQSRYRDTFILKGAYLLAVILNTLEYRPTKDIDFLKSGETDPQFLLDAIHEICMIPCIDDGVVFAPETMQMQPIREQNAYQGQRVKLLSFIGNARITLQIDIGIGDSIFPAPRTQTLHPILEMQAPTISTYPIETVIAEKLEAILALGLLTSRMKDFFDLFFISHHMSFEYDILVSAIQKTFIRRETSLPQQRPPVLSDEILADTQKQIQWKAFIRRIRHQDVPLPFADVIHQIQLFTDVFWKDCELIPGRWTPGTGWK